MKINFDLIFRSIITVFINWTQRLFKYPRLSAQRWNHPGCVYPSSWVFSVSDSCVHFAEGCNYLPTCCVKSNCTAKLARSLCKVNYSKWESSLQDCIVYISPLIWGFGIVLGVSLAFRYKGSYWTKCTFSAASDIFHINLYSAFLMTTTREQTQHLSSTLFCNISMYNI